MWESEVMDGQRGLVYIYIYIYIIAETERKWIPTIKEVVTNRKSGYLKFRHI